MERLRKGSRLREMYTWEVFEGLVAAWTNAEY